MVLLVHVYAKIIGSVRGHLGGYLYQSIIIQVLLQLSTL